MNIFVAGGTGFIGAALCRQLVWHGHNVVVLTRTSPNTPPHPKVTFVSWQTAAWRQSLARSSAVVNLAGASIAGQRWSTSRKEQLRESRTQTTRLLVEAIAAAPTKPAVLINASAIGYYGPQGDETLDETAPCGDGFLAQLCEEWEQDAQRAELLGVRVVRLRIGLVLGPRGGALAAMVPPFRFFLGGPLGSGGQWLSWIHRDDVIGLIEWVVASPQVAGALNATAPTPVTMREFCRTLGRVMRHPSWVLVPSFVLRALLGEMAEMLLTGQRVVPAAALAHGYAFRFPALRGALEEALRSWNVSTEREENRRRP